jgi:hypothetical protein
VRTYGLGEKWVVLGHKFFKKGDCFEDHGAEGKIILKGI